MRREETKELLKEISRLFPSLKVDDATKTIDAWQKYLEGLDKEQLDKALNDYITEESNAYAPSVSVLIALAKKHKPDSRFEGIEYWNRRTKSIYPFEWNSKVYKAWYTTDAESQRFYNYLLGGIEAIETGRIRQDELKDIAKVLKVYEGKKCLMMKKDS